VSLSLFKYYFLLCVLNSLDIELLILKCPFNWRTKFIYEKRHLIVGAGLYGAVTAYLAKQSGLKCLIIDKRNHIGGNVYSENKEGIEVHKYGPHIFHTNSKLIWKFASQFTDFNHFRYNPLARYKNNLYHLPFNMNTFHEIFGVETPNEAREAIHTDQRREFYTNPANLEEQAISLIGRTLYDLLVKGYTEKQWGKKATELPTSIIKRIPLRFTYDNNYFNDIYQGIPMYGYTKWVTNMLNNVEIKFGVDFLKSPNFWLNIAHKIIYCGSIDEFFEYELGELEYRSLRFEETLLENPDYQGCIAINETSIHVPYTRTIEHKHFMFGQQPITIITKEYPTKWEHGMEKYYPVNNERNNLLYKKYKQLAFHRYPNVSFVGRLGCYQYLNMDEVIGMAINNFNREILN